MAAYYEIHKALTQSLINLGLSVTIAHENTDFNPEIDGGGQFLSVHLLTNDQDSLTKSELDEVTGIYQVSVYTKTGGSVKAALQTVDTIMAHYKHNLKIINGSQTVVVINSGRNGGRNKDGWYIIDISINFKSDIQRT